MAMTNIKKIMVLIISLTLVTTMTFSMSVVTSSAASKMTRATKITSAKVYDKHYVSIKWNKINKATSYKVAYKVNRSSSKWKYKTVNENSGKLKLSYKTKYILKVKVYRKGYKSSKWSKAKYITTKALSKQMKATKITSATVTDQRYVTLKWNKVKKAASYKLAYKVDGSKADWKYKTVKAATSKLKLAYDTKYAFKVRVDNNKYRNSKWSAVKTVATEKENVYTVYFDPNGGKGEALTEKIAIGSEYSIPSYDYFNKSGITRDNYTQTGWNTKADGTGTFYSNGAPLKETVVAGDTINLYAVWQYNVVPVSKAYAVFDSKYGSLTFFKSTNTYTMGQTEGTKTYYTGIETDTYDRYDVPWRLHVGNASNNWTSDIKAVTFQDKIRPVSTAYWFYGCRNTEFDSITNISNLDTSNVTNMSHMFSDCIALTSLDLSRFDTGSVTDMSDMFQSCSALTSLDLSGFNTSNVTNMQYMFGSCSKLQSVNISSFNTSEVEDMMYMFFDCEKLQSLDCSNFNTSNVTDMNNMFSHCYALTSLDLSNFDTSNVTNMEGMFRDCNALTSLDLSSFDISNGTIMTDMFDYTCYSNNTGAAYVGYAKDAATAAKFNATDTTKINASKLSFEANTEVNHWNFGAENQTDPEKYSANTAKDTVIATLYKNGTLAITGNGNTQDTENGAAPWYSNESNIKRVTIENTVEPTSMNHWFSTCNNLVKAPIIPKSVKTMFGTFESCQNLTEAPVIPSNVTSLDSTFRACPKLIKAPSIPSSVTSMVGTFYECTSLIQAPVIPNSVKEISHIFSGCSALTGSITINANPTDYADCFGLASTNTGTSLTVNYGGDCTQEKAEAIVNTKSANSNITLGNPQQ